LSQPNKNSSYEKVWILIKDKGKCELAATPALHPRIIKAVIKRKYMDLGFKLLCQEQCKRAKLQYKVEGSKITFTLKYSIGLEDL
jgi:hypothetical protein